MLAVEILSTSPLYHKIKCASAICFEDLITLPLPVRVRTRKNLSASNVPLQHLSSSPERLEARIQAIERRTCIHVLDGRDGATKSALDPES